MAHTTISQAQAEIIAQAWAHVAEIRGDDVRSDVELRPVDGGYLAEVVVYSGTGPFTPLGTAAAYIDDAGRLSPLAA